MDIVEKFIRQISYKFPKGYIDMNNEQDVILLNSLLEDIDQKNPQTFTQCKEILLNVVKLKKDIVDEIEKIALNSGDMCELTDSGCNGHEIKRCH